MADIYPDFIPLPVEGIKIENPNVPATLVPVKKVLVGQIFPHGIFYKIRIT